MKLNRFFQNFLFISGGQVVSLLLNFISLTLVARFIGVENYGQFNYVLAIAIIISKLVDFGLGPITYRESARRDTNTYINSAISLRIIMFFFVLTLFNVFAFLVKLSAEEIILTNILFANILVSSKFQNIRDLLDIPFKIKTLSKYSTYAIIIDNILFLLLILLIPIYNLGILYVVLAYVLSNIPGFIFILICLKRKGDFQFRFDISNARILILEALPLMGYVAFITIYQQFDVLILKNIDSNYSAGIFSAAARLTMPFNIIPAAIVSTIFPLMVANVHDPIKARHLNSLIYKILFFISFAIAIISVFKAEELVVIIFGNEYRESYIPFIFLFLSQIFLFYNFFTVDLLTAHNKQKIAFFYAFVLVFINLLIALYLIPRYSFDGAGFAKLISIFIGFLFLYFSSSKFGINAKFLNFRVAAIVILISTALYLLSDLHIALYVVSSVILILFVSLKLKFFNDSEIISIFKLFNKEKWADKIIKI